MQHYKHDEGLQHSLLHLDHSQPLGAKLEISGNGYNIPETVATTNNSPINFEIIKKRWIKLIYEDIDKEQTDQSKDATLHTT